MRERARELKAEATKADGEKDLLAAVAKMEEPARGMATKSAQRRQLQAAGA